VYVFHRSKKTFTGSVQQNDGPISTKLASEMMATRDDVDIFAIRSKTLLLNYLYDIFILTIIAP
jgi:hypothetical protein